MCALFALADRECSERMMSIGSPDEASLHDLAGALRDLKCETDVYLWLDDFVNWGIETPGKFLEILSRHGGERLHIIVSTSLWAGKMGRLLPKRRDLETQGRQFYFRGGRH